MGKAFIGISGWTYAGWRGVFYPPKLTHRRELEYASHQLNSIEINGTFYRPTRAAPARGTRANAGAAMCSSTTTQRSARPSMQWASPTGSS